MVIKADMSKVIEDKEQRDAAKGSKRPYIFIPRYEMKGKEAKLRILPPWTDKGDNAYKIFTVLYQHWKVSDSFKAPITCTRLTHDYKTGECEICDLVESLKASGQADLLDLAKDMQAKAVWLYNVIDLADPKWTQKDYDAYMLKATARGAKAEEVTVPFEVGAPKIQVFAAKSTVHDGITNGIKENDGLDITDLDRGHNITITKTGTTQFDTKYAVTIMIAPSKCIVNESNCNLNELDKVNPPLEANKVTELLGSGKAQAARAVLGSGAPKVRGSLAADSKAAARGVDPAEAKRVAKEAFRGSPVEEEEGDSDDIDLEGLERELRGE